MLYTQPNDICYNVNKPYIGVFTLKSSESRKRAYTKYNHKKYPSVKCTVCSKEFRKNSTSKTCSLKCRIREGSINKGNCWIWTKSQTGTGYGKVRWESKTLSAHRASYQSFHGNIPKGKMVCHTCDNPLCVNPEHLWIGTAKDNALDKSKKGRGVYKDKNVWGKLNDNQINEILLLKKEGVTYKRLSRIFDVSVVWLTKIVKNQGRP